VSKYRRRCTQIVTPRGVQYRWEYPEIRKDSPRAPRRVLAQRLRELAREIERGEVTATLEEFIPTQPYGPGAHLRWLVNMKLRKVEPGAALMFQVPLVGPGDD